MTYNVVLAGLALLAAGLLAGCMSSQPYIAATPVDVSGLSSSAVLLEVTTAAPGGPYDCGVLAVGAVAQFYGRPISAESSASLRELARRQEHLTARDMVTALKLGGMEVFAFTGDLGDEISGIPWHLKAGRPCIVLIKRNEGEDVGHFVVVCGHDPERQLVLIADAENAIVGVPQAEFERVWGNGGRILLVAAPGRE